MKVAILSLAFLAVAVSGSIFDDQSITMTTPACPPCECVCTTTTTSTTTTTTSTTTTPTTTSTTTTTTTPTTTTTTPTTIKPDEYECHSCVSNKCDPAGGIDFSIQLPYPGDCTRFCKCDRAYVAKRFECPAGLHFNRELQLCDWPSASRCTVQSTYIGGCEVLIE